MTLSALPSRLSPAAASSVASATPASSLLRRVSTLPRNGTIWRSGRARNIWAARRIEEEPSLAPCGNASRLRYLSETKASRTSSRSRKAASTSPSGRNEARSLLEWTPRSISSAASAASISRENSPLPPASLSGRSVSLSPLVVMTRISIRSAGTPCASANSRCVSCAWASASMEPRVPMRRNGADCISVHTYCRPKPGWAYPY